MVYINTKQISELSKTKYYGPLLSPCDFLRKAVQNHTLVLLWSNQIFPNYLQAPTSKHFIRIYRDQNKALHSFLKEKNHASKSQSHLFICRALKHCEITMYHILLIKGVFKPFSTQFEN